MTTLRYFGHSCFLLKDGTNSVLIDPFLSGNPHAGGVPADLNPTTILVSHGHGDHIGDTLEIAKRSNATVLAVFEIGEWLGQQGVEKTIPAGLGGIIKFDWGTAKLVQAFHSSTIEFDGKFLPGGDPCGYLISIGGKNIYFAGDTCLFSDMRLIGEMAQPQLDLALLPIGGHFTMGIDDAVKAVSFCNPRTVIPMHYNTFDVVAADPNEFKRKVEASTKSRCVVVPPGSEYTLE